MIDNVFYLNPPTEIKPFHLNDSVAIFKQFRESAPEGVWPKGSQSLQGLYVMDPEGNFLSGGFSYQSKHTARRVLDKGLKEWTNIVEGKSDPIPAEPMPVVDGRPESDYYTKLQVTYRDLPLSLIHI